MDDVELSPVSGDREGLLVVGPQAVAALLDLGLQTAPIAADTLKSVVWQKYSLDIIATNGPTVPRIEIWSDLTTILELQQDLTAAGATPLSPAALEALRILSGTPRYGTDIRNTETARDLPQETAQTHALHFSKGCYLGQEIVERIRSRGNVHRTFTGFLLTGELPSPGTTLESEGKPVGELTSVAAIPLPTGTIQLALGYIRREAVMSIQAGSIPLTYPGGTATPTTLPYRN
jgi:aminomethyltransferase